MPEGRYPGASGIYRATRMQGSSMAGLRLWADRLTASWPLKDGVCPLYRTCPRLTTWLRSLLSGSSIPCALNVPVGPPTKFINPQAQFMPASSAFMSLSEVQRGGDLAEVTKLGRPKLQSQPPPPNQGACCMDRRLDGQKAAEIVPSSWSGLTPPPG